MSHRKAANIYKLRCWLLQLCCLDDFGTEGLVHESRARAYRGVRNLLGMLVILLLIFVPASAARAESFATFGSEGEEAGQLSIPHGVAFDTSNGYLYVADTGNDRVDVFNSSGQFIMAFGWGVASDLSTAQTCTIICHKGLSGAGAGEFESPEGIVVDNDPSSPSYHDIYVTDVGNNRVEEFTPSGEFVLMFGGEVNKTTHENVCTALSGDLCGAGTVGSAAGQFSSIGAAVADDSSGRVWVGDSNRVQIFESTGVYSSQVALTGNYGNTEALAVDSSGDFYVLAGGSAATFAVRKYNPSGELQYALQEEPYQNIHGIAADASGDIFIYDGGTKGFLSEYNSSGTELSHFGYSVPGGQPRGTMAAYAGTLGTLYYPESAFGASRIVAVTVPPPDPVILKGTASASQVANTHATLNATVDPEGVKTTYSYQYVDATDFEHNGEGFSSPATHTSSLATVGPDFKNDAVSTPINGLSSETTYHYRIQISSECEPIAHPGKQCLATGEEATFTTLAPVVIDRMVVANLGFESAELQVSVNTLGVSSTGYFQYVSQVSFDEHGFEGATDMPDVTQGAAPISLGSGTVEREFGVTISGLSPSTLYVYRFVGTNSGGTADGPSGAFETYPVGITGLPDGRIYELVTPAFKNGNSVSFLYKFDFGLASADGDAVMYPTNGAVGTAVAGMLGEYVSHRIPGVGWTTTSAMSRPTNQISALNAPTTIVPSSDFQKFLYAGPAPFSAGDKQDSLNIFLGENPLNEPIWISRPQVSDPIPAPEAAKQPNYAIAGAAPDLSVVYFTYAGTLLSEDEERAVHVGSGTGEGRESDLNPWGLYEWADGSLQEAGTLPDGSLNPYGAVPADLGIEKYTDRLQELQAGVADNSVSSNGSRLFFISPDPKASSVSNPGECKMHHVCTSEPPQLYMREAMPDGSHRVILISASQLPESSGEPAANGVVAVPNSRAEGTTFAFASADGSHVFFASTGRLTATAPEDGSVKEYDYDVNTGSLTYISDVQGGIAAATLDGSELLFVNRTRMPEKIEVWHEGPNGGTITSVAELPEAAKCREGTCVGDAPATVRSAHVSTDGSVFVFVTNSRLPGFNNGGVSHNSDDEYVSSFEVYRYDMATGGLDCLSCPPVGIIPRGDAEMSYATSSEGDEINNTSGKTNTGGPTTTIETRGMSADGSRVFFDTPNALVPQDTNGTRDVYEWENGKVYLISSGTSSEESFYLDNSESGGDVFFVTSTGLVPADTDESYDVYDARIPRPGDNSPPAAVPCKGSICQGPPSVPQLLGAPASAVFNGIGDVNPDKEAKSSVKKKSSQTQAKKKKKRKKTRKARAGSAHRPERAAAHHRRKDK